MAELVSSPNLEVQREAMQKLSFLAGTWAGECRLHRGPGEALLLAQTEQAQYKLDGLILLIEGIGRAGSADKPVLQALGIICYDDLSASYRMRAFNDGRFLEAQVKLMEDGKGLTWGFTLGPVRTASTLRINEEGEWTELAEIAIGDQPPRRLLELAVHRVDESGLAV